VPATRREFLGLAAGALLVGGCRSGDGDAGAPVRDTTTTSLPTTTTEAPVGPNPFTLGVASGDPDTTSVVLWTHVDRPADAAVDLVVEVATDEDFTDIVTRSPALADPAAGMTVRVVAGDLDADTRYWYRFVLDGHRTPVARTRTAPAPGAVPREPLRFGHLSCQRYSSGYWTALDDVAALAPDLVVHCGDYVYESDHLGDVRPLDTRPPTSLEEYRELWRRYRAEPELQAAHAVAPWLVVWDDHEVENNYQGSASAREVDTADFLELRAAAYRAWWEFTPTRVDQPVGPSVRMHRQVDWGGLTRFVLLDTRQHRDDQPCGDSDTGARCAATDDLTMLGPEQEAWVGEAVQHEAVWTTVVQQVVLHQWRLLPGNVLWNLDQWDGYTGARDRFLGVLAGAPDPVVLSGDVHSSWVSDLRSDFEDQGSDPVGVEFVAPGVSSGVPADLAGRGELVELSSPHIVWSETRRRGWVLHTVTEGDWTAEFRLVADATRPGSDVAAEDRFTVSAGARRIG
jgi:alkaline phosphatase D